LETTEAIMISINGVDTSIGLACTGHNEPLYLRLLGTFRDNERPFVERVRSLIAASQIEQAQRLANDLRWTAGMIGAIELSSSAALLETALRRGVEAPLLDRYLSTIERSLNPVLADLDRVL
jgi:HPt (histidine-containing phosphotransfer) domain-containing protein